MGGGGTACTNGGATVLLLRPEGWGEERQEGKRGLTACPLRHGELSLSYGLNKCAADNELDADLMPGTYSRQSGTSVNGASSFLGHHVYVLCREL